MTYTWDIENIMAVAARLEAEKANIDRQRRELEKYRSKTAGVFQGEAGTQFAENLDTDISNMHLVSEMIDGQVCRLRNIARSIMASVNRFCGQK